MLSSVKAALFTASVAKSKGSEAEADFTYPKRPSLGPQTDKQEDMMIDSVLLVFKLFYKFQQSKRWIV